MPTNNKENFLKSPSGFHIGRNSGTTMLNGNGEPYTATEWDSDTLDSLSIGSIYFDLVTGKVYSKTDTLNNGILDWEELGSNATGGSSSLAVNDTMPIGSVLAWNNSTTPSNYLLCDGSAVSRTTYEALFNVIGTDYGVGDGSTTFNLPDFTGDTINGTGINWLIKHSLSDTDIIRLSQFNSFTGILTRTANNTVELEPHGYNSLITSNQTINTSNMLDGSVDISNSSLFVCVVITNNLLTYGFIKEGNVPTSYDYYIIINSVINTDASGNILFFEPYYIDNNRVISGGWYGWAVNGLYKTNTPPLADAGGSNDICATRRIDDTVYFKGVMSSTGNIGNTVLTEILPSGFLPRTSKLKRFVLPGGDVYGEIEIDGSTITYIDNQHSFNQELPLTGIIYNIYDDASVLTMPPLIDGSYSLAEFFSSSSGTHGSLGGLDQDDHTQYTLLAGRTGGQHLYGSVTASENITLESTSNPTKGKVIIADTLELNNGTIKPETNGVDSIKFTNDDETVNVLTIDTTNNLVLDKDDSELINKKKAIAYSIALG